MGAEMLTLDLGHFMPDSSMFVEQYVGRQGETVDWMAEMLTLDVAHLSLPASYYLMQCTGRQASR